MEEIKILKDTGMTFWAKKGENNYSRNIKDLLDYLEIDYVYEESSENASIKNKLEEVK